jgi:hypothetical protein
LDAIDESKHYDIFVANKFTNVLVCGNLTEKDLDTLGITVPGERYLSLVTSLISTEKI